MTAKMNVPETKEILDELKQLGKNLKLNAGKALKSEQREKVEIEFKKGLKTFTEGVDQVIKDFKKGELDDKIRVGINTSLKDANSALKKAAKQWKPVKK